MPQSYLFKKRSGMTLVELLVVIAIIGLLVALLLPAVQAARESARRSSCLNNIKQLGLALHQYHDTHGEFPPGSVGPRGGFPQFAGLKHHGLGIYLVPYLEQQSLFDEYHWDVSWFDAPNQPVVNTHLKIWQCPSAEPNRIQDGSLVTVTPPPVTLFGGTAACGDYAGMGHVEPELARNGLIEAPAGPRDEGGNFEGIFLINARRSLADIQDGASHTIMMAECAGRPQLWQGQREAPNLWLTGGPWASRNTLWCRGATWDGTELYGPCAINCMNDRGVYSFHPGGANAVFADGSVHFLRADMEIQVFARLVTRAGGEVVTDGDF